MSNIFFYSGGRCVGLTNNLGKTLPLSGCYRGQLVNNRYQTMIHITTNTLNTNSKQQTTHHMWCTYEGYMLCTILTPVRHGVQGTMDDVACMRKEVLIVNYAI